MHKNHTIHRDIKLENIVLNFEELENIVSKDGVIPKRPKYNEVELNNLKVKICDLGYAKEMDTMCASTICGTPFTMAPENLLNMFKANKNEIIPYNDKVDLWSLGALTYEILTGNPPFYANNWIELKKKIEEGSYKISSFLKISEEAISFINSLLQFYPEKRATWDQILDHDFLNKKVDNFHFIDLEKVPKQFNNAKELELNTKKCDNFLWLLFQVKTEKKNEVKNIQLDKINPTVLKETVIVQDKGEVKENENDSRKQSSESDGGKGMKPMLYETIKINESHVNKNFIGKKVESKTTIDQKTQPQEEDENKENNDEILNITSIGIGSPQKINNQTIIGKSTTQNNYQISKINSYSSDAEKEKNYLKKVLNNSEGKKEKEDEEIINKEIPKETCYNNITNLNEGIIPIKLENMDDWDIISTSSFNEFEIAEKSCYDIYSDYFKI
jgi:serine/threonine protein kinase